ncbi:MAG: rubrerythrin family protein [Ignavibacteriaceae bacterium]
MMKTEENLKIAFAKESQASQRYRAFSKRARKDGYPNIARLFKLASEVERIHAQNNLNALNMVGTTLENLNSAITRERNESKTMYPSILKQAVSDNHKARLLIENNIKSKEAHSKLYFAALAALNDGNDLTNGELFLCPFCGNILAEKPDQNCTICTAPAGKFIAV